MRELNLNEMHIRNTASERMEKQSMRSVFGHRFGLSGGYGNEAENMISCQWKVYFTVKTQEQENRQCIMFRQKEYYRQKTA